MEPYSLTVVQPNVRPVLKQKGGFEAAHLKENLDHAAALAQTAARYFQSKLIVFPEFFLHGFQPGRPVSEWIEASIAVPGPVTEELGKVAKATGAYLCGMVYEVDSDYPGRYFNTAIIIDPKGEIVLRYRKLYAMTSKTRPGDIYSEYVEKNGGPTSLFPVVDTPLGKLGCLVCYDINFPEVTRCLALQGAEVFLHCSSESRSPYHLPDGGWTMARRVRAYENVAYLATANTGLTLTEDGAQDISHGHSQIVDFNGRVMNMAETSNETMISAEIDIEALRRRRAKPKINFLAEVSTQIHAPIYAAAQGWPIDHWADKPIADAGENRVLEREVIAKMTANGILKAPRG